MPGLDVSDAFDIDMFDIFSLIRATQTVSSHGRPVNVPTVIPSQYGVFTSASPDDLERAPGADISHKAITITTKVRLQLASTGPDADTTIKADVIYWAGDYYQIKHVEDYSRFGQGYIWALAEAIDYQIASPTPAV